MGQNYRHLHASHLAPRCPCPDAAVRHTWSVMKSCDEGPGAAEELDWLLPASGPGVGIAVALQCLLWAAGGYCWDAIQV